MATQVQEKTRKALMDLVSLQDPSVFQDVEKFVRLMKEKSGLGDTSELAALKKGLTDLIPWELRKLAKTAPIRPQTQQMADQFAAKHAIATDLAWWTIETWASGVGLPIEPAPVTPPPQTTPAAAGKPAAVPQVPTTPAAQTPTGPSTPPGLREPATRLGLLYGIDDRNAIRVFQAWCKPQPTQTADSLIALPVKRETAAVKPFAGVETPKPKVKPARSSASSSKPVSQASTGSPALQKQVPVRPPPAPPPQPQPKPAVLTGKPSLLKPISVTGFGPAADQFYTHGLAILNPPVGRPNMQEVVKAFVQAAKLGHILAEYRIGEIYLKGIGVKEDHGVAFKWFESAAKKGFAEAMIQLGSMYQCGIGIEPNVAEARQWYDRAAHQGNAEAQQLLNQLG